MSDAAAEPVDHMSDFEALMWQLEKSPMLANQFANVTVLDRPPDRAALLARMAGAVRKVPRLHQHPVAAAGRLANPQWHDDPDFDLDHHIRWVDLGGHASDDDLNRFVAQTAGQPFDRERPLWDFTVIEGLSDGRAAMLQRLHHTITDGEGGIRLSLAFIDLERSPDVPPPEPGRSAVDPAGADGASDVDPDSGRQPTPDGPGIAEAARAVSENVRRRGGQLVGVLGSAGDLARHPSDAAELARSTVRQARTPPRCSPIWTERSLQRWFGTTTLDLAEVKDAAHRLGGSVNDFFVTGATAGAGAYHRRHGAPVDQLRLSMPVSVRRAKAKDERRDPMSGGNAFAPTRSLVPTGDMEPAERFTEVHEILAASRSERALNVLDGAAAVANLLPTAALLATGERATAGIDFVCSNVRAAPFDLYIGGALMLTNYPVGPLAGTAFNVTTMSYRGTLCIGLSADSVAVEHPEELLKDITASWTELMSAAAARPPANG